MTFSLFPAAVLSFSLSTVALAGSATWNLNPTSGDWNTAANWTPNVVPNGPEDVATLGPSSQVDLSFSGNTELGAAVFDPSAPGYTLTTGSPFLVRLGGAGVINDSASPQAFVLATNELGNGEVSFTNSATAGEGTSYIVNGSLGADGAIVTFYDTSNAGTASFAINGSPLFVGGWGTVEFHTNSTAADATLVNNAGTVGFGGRTFFYDNSNAGQANVTNKGAIELGGANGITVFYDTAMAGNATLINEGCPFNGFNNAGKTWFYQSSTADNATFLVHGGTDAGGEPGAVVFAENSSAGNATFLAYKGAPRARGGEIYLEDRSDGATSRIVLVHSSTTLDIGAHQGRATVGSIEGSGVVQMENGSLAVGTNNLDTEFSGVIAGDGPFVKLGKGRLVLTGANTYIGPFDGGPGTIIIQGALIVNNTSGSGTGAAPVAVRGGMLGGNGIIAGAVEVGSVISPGKGAKSLGTLTIQSGLTLNATATYHFAVNTNSGVADKIVANGVTIIVGARFFVIGGNAPLAQGTIFTAIDNTSAIPIAGTFSNLPDGGTISGGPNNFQANYEGGDGNDLTLTVVP